MHRYRANYWTKFPLSGLHMACGKPDQHIEELQFPVTNMTYVSIILSSANNKAKALNCSVTVMDGINTQFWGKSLESKMGIGASLVPQIHYTSLQRFLPCRKLRKE